MKSLRTLVGVVISLALLWILLRAADPSELLETLRGKNYALLPPAILVYFIGVWVRGLRWRLLLKPVALLPATSLFKAILIGFTVNDLLPARLGELARVALLGRWAKVPAGATLGTIVVERLFDGLTLCLLLIVARLFIPLTPFLEAAALIGGLLFATATVIACLAAFWPAMFMKIAQSCIFWAPDRLRSRLLRLCSTFLDGFAVLRDGRVLLQTSWMSIFAWLSEATMYYIIMQGFGFDTGPLGSLLGMVAANLGTMVPSSPGFVGTFDVPLQGVLTEQFGVPASLATSYTLVVHASLLIPVVLAGLILLWREGLSLGELSRVAPRPVSAGQHSTDSAARAL